MVVVIAHGRHKVMVDTGLKVCNSLWSARVYGRARGFKVNKSLCFTTVVQDSMVGTGLRSTRVYGRQEFMIDSDLWLARLHGRQDSMVDKGLWSTKV